MTDRVFLGLTGLLAAWLCAFFLRRYRQRRALHDAYYLMAFAVLLASGALLLFLGLGILGSPWVLTVATLFPLGISMGLAEEHFRAWKSGYKWFAAIGFLAVAVSAIGGLEAARKIVVPLVHGTAGLLIVTGPFLAKGAPGGYYWVGVGGLLISLGGVALAFISLGGQLLFFSPDFVATILTPLLFLTTAAFALGFTRGGATGE